MARVVAGTNEVGQLGAALDLLAPLLGTFDLSTPETRWAALVEITRLAGEVAIRSRVGTRDWELWVGVWVVTVTNPGNKTDPKLRQALADGLEDTGEAWDQLFDAIMDRLGLRLRPGLTLRQLTESTGAMAAGYALARPAATSPRCSTGRRDPVAGSRRGPSSGPGSRPSPSSSSRSTPSGHLPPDHTG